MTHLKNSPILPGGSIGLLGGGQLGRMFALAARRLGYQIHVVDPSPNSPAGPVCDTEHRISYQNVDAVKNFVRNVDVVSFEFENIPANTLRVVEALRPVRPGPEVLNICQNREREKNFLSAQGYPLSPYRVVDSAASLRAAISDLGFPCVLKTADFGYDGKGQRKIEMEEKWEKVWLEFGAKRGVVEKWVAFEKEMSVICARGIDGTICSYPVAENIQTSHILDYSIVPARVDSHVQLEVETIASDIAETLGVVGLLAVEFFLTQDRRVLVNELAPRPHNSGHFTLDACVTSQFEQHVRAICGLPLGSPALLSPVVMVNLLGDLWQRGTPNWLEILSEPFARLHIYGKSQPKRGRKMGHYCVLGNSLEGALNKALALRARL